MCWQESTSLFNRLNTPIGLLADPPYSRDLVTCDVFFFSWVKGNLRAKRFAGIEVVKRKTADFLKNITDDISEQCFGQWKKRLDNYIHSGGEYLDVD